MGEPIFKDYIQKTILETMEFQVIDEGIWREWQEKNSDNGYGAGVLRYAVRWAKCMQYAIEVDGQPLEAVAQQLAYDVDDEGITGFMYGAAVRILASCWKYGEELRVWHNAQYNAKKSKGVVNPAILTTS